MDREPPDQAGVEAPADPVLDVLWRRALESWDDPQAHDALLEHATRTHLLPDLAGRYRALAEDPDKGPTARQQIDAIVAAATALLMSTKTPVQPRPPAWITLVAGALCLLLLAWLAYAVLRARSGRLGADAIRPASRSAHVIPSASAVHVPARS